MGTQRQALYVPHGKHRFAEAPKIWGTIPLQTKVSTYDTDGAMFIFEHADLGRGGPRAISTMSKTSDSARSRASSP